MSTYPHVLPTSGVIPGWGYHDAREVLVLDSETNQIVEILPIPVADGGDPSAQPETKPPAPPAPIGG